jgi:hypothetical protein
MLIVMSQFLRGIKERAVHILQLSVTLKMLKAVNFVALLGTLPTSVREHA